MIYSFDLTTSTHDLLQQGIVAGRFFGSQNNYQRVTVEADSLPEAMQLAIQLGMCFGYVTDCMVRI